MTSGQTNSTASRVPNDPGVKAPANRLAGDATTAAQGQRIETAAADEARFREELAALEKAAETPVVSGELETWLESVATALSVAAPAFSRRAADVYAVMFEQMIEADDAMLPRVQSLQQEQAALEQQFERLQHALHQMHVPLLRPADADAAAAGSEGETRAALARPNFAEDVVSLAVRVRKFATELETWHRESLLRDRGVVD